MENQDYGYRKSLSGDFIVVVEKAKAALAEQGFGILTEIDVKATMKKKLDKDVDDYLILGACNPKLASKAMDGEQEIGLLLPCNVIVYKKGEEVVVSAIVPSVAMGFVDNKDLKCVAGMAETKLKLAIDSL